ncbi:MAG TPA: RNA polymerase sigma factor [Candidatus Limnocylindria bacterium]|nr:RNA polymerase sigma factor [Candidatus Limnocylindria bacterium]
MTDAALVAADPARDGDLVSRARGGDADAFGLLVNARLSRMLRLAKGILGNADDATEVVQETFLSAWVHLPSLRDHDKFDPWLNRALANRCRDLIRRRNRSREIVLDVTELERTGPSTPAVGYSAIREAFGHLSVEHRQILLLHHVHDLSVAEIAHQLGIPEGTAKSRLWTARRALERILENES